MDLYPKRRKPIFYLILTIFHEVYVNKEDSVHPRVHVVLFQLLTILQLMQTRHRYLKEQELFLISL